MLIFGNCMLTPDFFDIFHVSTPSHRSRNHLCSEPMWTFCLYELKSSFCVKFAVLWSTAHHFPSIFDCDLFLQVQGTQGFDHHYKGIIDCFKRVPVEQGFLSFWRGNFTNLLRYVPQQAIQLSCKDTYHRWFMTGIDQKTEFWKFFAGVSLFVIRCEISYH